MKQFWIVSGLVVAALGASALIVAGGAFLGNDPAPPSTRTQDMPWQVQPLPDGSSQVLGLRLSPDLQRSSAIGDVQQRWGDAVQIAIVAAPNEAGTIEAYVDPMQAGFISGKAIITASLPPDVIRGMRERAIKTEYMGGTTRKATLSPADLTEALKAPITSVSFIPSANLDEDIILSRFGQPAQRLRSNEHLEHFLYPDKGLDLTLDGKGKELLQYIAPAHFDKLRQPLEDAQRAAETVTSPGSAP